MVFKFLVGRVAKMVGRKINTTFYTALYREIYKEVKNITQSETEASKIMKQLGINGTLESAQRQEQILRLFPNDPKKVMDYLPIIWQVIFGQKMNDYTVTEETVESSDYPALIYQIKKCPVCAGYGTLKEDNLNCKKIDKDESNFAAGLVGMLQETANFILGSRGNEYRINITETKCFCKGDDIMELYCHVIKKEDFTENALGAEDIIMKNPPAINIDLDKIEEVLTKPLDTVKEQVAKLIKDKMQMTPEEMMDHFRNYEDDMVRIIGFLMIHIINENGRIVEKMAENETFSKLIGHIYKNMVEMTNIYVPNEIIEDYQKLLIDFLTGLAPDEMVASFQRIPASRMTDLFYEGIEKALVDLGINFEGLKSNIWEELEVQKAVDAIPGWNSDKDASEEEKRRSSEIKMRIIQEVFMLLNAIISLPTRIMITGTHEITKSAITSGGEIFANVRSHAESLFDLVEQLKE